MARILVIEDDPQVLSLFVEVLGDAGHEVHGARDGLEGVRLMRGRSADLVITDILMPEKDGFETIRELRDGFPEAKIIAVSGGGSLPPDLCLNVAEKLGANLALTKPVDIGTLVEAVRNLLGDG